MSLDDFKILQKLGSGAYSSVYKVQRLLDNDVYALKKVNLNGMSNKQKQNALNQIRILASVCNSGVIGYREAFFDESSRSLCIIMQYADNGDLYQKIMQKTKNNEYFQQRQIWNVFIQIVRGLRALHTKNIFHRDLKSANVFLLNDGRAKIGDMNVSKISEKGLCQTQTGTPYYASPQVWKDQVYGMKSDIWSLGVVLYEMICLTPPFQAEDMQSLYKKVIKADYPKISDKYSSDLGNLVRILLQADPHKRPSCERILSMSIVSKRIKNSQQLFDNPEFLQTIRMPNDIYYLTEHLPKPNYYTPKKIETLKDSVKLKNNRYKPFSGNLHKINSNLIKKDPRSYIINHRTIIEAAREEVKHERRQFRDVQKDIIFHKERLIKKKRDDSSSSKLMKEQRKKGLRSNKIEDIQKVYQGYNKNKTIPRNE